VITKTTLYPTLAPQLHTGYWPERGKEGDEEEEEED